MKATKHVVVSERVYLETLLRAVSALRGSRSATLQASIRLHLVDGNWQGAHRRVREHDDHFSKFVRSFIRA